jgi:hypothetical protein
VKRAAAFATSFFFGQMIIKVSKLLPKVVGYTILVRDPKVRVESALLGSFIMARNPTGVHLIAISSQSLPLILRVYAG